MAKENITGRFSGKFTPFTLQQIQKEADKEKRSFNSMLEILALEALNARTPAENSKRIA